MKKKGKTLGSPIGFSYFPIPDSRLFQISDFDIRIFPGDFSSSLSCKQSSAAHPIGGAVWPRGDEFLRTPQAVAVAGLGIDVQFHRDAGLFEGQGVKKRVFHANWIILGDGDEGRWSVSGDPYVGRDFVAVLFQGQIGGVNQHREIRAATDIVGKTGAPVSLPAGGR